MRWFKYWFLGNIVCQLLLLLTIYLVSQFTPEAVWLIFLNYYAGVASFLQFPFMWLGYKLKQEWQWWQLVLLWLLTFSIAFFISVKAQNSGWG